MRQSKYRLQPVLDVRERAKGEAARLVAVRRAQLAEAEAELARREREVVRCREQQSRAQAKMLAEARAGAAASQLVKHRTHLTDLRRQEQELLAAVEQQRVVVERAAAQLETAVSGLVEASKEMQVIEKHRENWQADERRAEGRREQKSNDEMGAVIHRRNRSE